MLPIIEEPITIVPAIPKPRKNKLILKGYFNVWDVPVILVGIAVIILLAVFVAHIWWSRGIVVIVGVVILFGLCYPFGFMRKEKLYLFFARGLAYAVGQKYYRSEEWSGRRQQTESDNSTNKTSKTLKEVNGSKEE